MSGYRLEYQGHPATDVDSEEAEPQHWAGRPLRSTLMFLAGPAALAVAIMVFHLRLPPLALYGMAGVFGVLLLWRSFSDPEWLLAVTTLYIPLNKVYVIALGAGINGTNMLLMLLLLCWVMRVMSEDRPVFRALPHAKLVGIFAALTMFSGVTSTLTFGVDFMLDDQISTNIRRGGDQFILYFAVLNLIRDGHMARRVVVYMMLGTLVVMLLGAQEALDKQGLNSIEKSRVLGAP